MSEVKFDKFLAIVSDEKVDTLERAKARQKKRPHLRASQQIALLIAKQLDTLGWTQKKLAEHLSVSPQLVNKWLKGNENFTLETLLSLSSCLKIQLIEIKSITEKKEISEVSSVSIANYQHTARIIKLPVSTNIAQKSIYGNQLLAK